MLVEPSRRTVVVLRRSWDFNAKKPVREKEHELLAMGFFFGGGPHIASKRKNRHMQRGVGGAQAGSSLREVGFRWA